MKIYNTTKNIEIGSNVKLARGFFTRFKGLMFKKRLEYGSGLMLSPCSMIHTFCMNIPIDVVYISRGGLIIHTIQYMKPNRFGPYVKGCVKVLELPAGTLLNSGTKIGDVLNIS